MNQTSLTKLWSRIKGYLEKEAKRGKVLESKVFFLLGLLLTWITKLVTNTV